MSIKPKFIVASAVVVAILIWLGFTAQEWGNNAIGYASISQAQQNKKVSYIKGYWLKEKPTEASSNVFSFYLKDEEGNVAQVVYRNGKPNNFEQASSIVVQGKVENGIIYAKDILVKCPSKYQSEKADSEKKG